MQMIVASLPKCIALSQKLQGFPYEWKSKIAVR